MRSYIIYQDNWFSTAYSEYVTKFIGISVNARCRSIRIPNVIKLEFIVTDA